MLVQSGERLTVLGDRLLIALVAYQFLRVALAAGDVAAHAYFGLVATQLATRIHGLAQAARGALRGATAQETRNDLDRDVGKDTRQGDAGKDQHPDPQLIASGLDDMNDERRLYEERKNEEPRHRISPRNLVHRRRGSRQRKSHDVVALRGSQRSVAPRANDDVLTLIGPRAVGHGRRLTAGGEFVLPQFASGL